MSSISAKASNISSKPMNINQTSPGSIQPTRSSTGPTENNNRRDGGGGSAAARHNQSNPRGNQSAKKNHVDRRRPARDNELHEQMAQLDVAVSRGSNRRGTSITHLMDWNLPWSAMRPRNYNTNQRRSQAGGLGSGYHAVDKARYVNANYRFIVDSARDYRAQSVDSDIHVPWDSVLQVLASAKSQTVNCPICLCVPAAPRMAKCGHIFCLPCLLRYMASVEDFQVHTPEKKAKYKKCPICWDSVYMTDVRPVRWFIGQEEDALQDGVDVALRLMRRHHGTTLALPKDGAETPEESNGIPWHFTAEVSDYARIMKGTRSYMVVQFKQEILDLQVIGSEDELMFNEEGEWTRKAISMIEEQIEDLNTKDMGSLPPSQRGAEATKAKDSLRPLSLPINKDHRSGSAGDSIPSYHFYRALPHYYLSPLDIRILKSEFGTYECFPATILPRVEAVSTGHTVDDDFRKRMKYLGHLPYGTEVAFLECDWAGVVSPEVLENFKTEIERRRKRRRDKESLEEKDRQRAEKAERDSCLLQQHQPLPKPTTEWAKFTEDDFVALTNTQVDDVSFPGATPPVGELGVVIGSRVPALETPPNAPRTVWGTPAVALQGDVPTVQPPPSEHPDGRWADGWEPGDFLEDRLSLYHIDDELLRTSRLNQMGAARDGARKKKKVVLMNNGGTRGA